MSQENGGRIQRIARSIRACFHGLNRALVHHLQGGGDDAAGHDLRDGACGGVDGREGGEQRVHRLRVGHEPDGYVERDAEAPFAADEGPEQVVSLGEPDRVSERGDRAVREQDGAGDHVVQRDAVLEAVGTAGVLRDIAPDGARRLAGRIRSVVEAVRRRGLGELHVHHARLHVGQTVHRIDRQDPGQAVEADQDHVVGEGAAGEARPRPSGDEGGAGTRQELDDRNQFVPRARKDHDARRQAIAGEGIGIEGRQLGRPVLDPAGPGDRDELVAQGGVSIGHEERKLAVRRPCP